MNSFDIFQCRLQGIHLIDASAGTGKTYTITGLVLRLLLEKNLSIEQILVVTYTEAATKELRDKIRSMLRFCLDGFESENSNIPIIEECLQQYPDREAAIIKLTDALAGFDLAAIFTIHGFCQRMLKEYGFETAGLFDTELLTDDSELKEEIAMDFWRNYFYSASFLFVSYAHESFHNQLSPILTRSLIQADVKILPDSTDVYDEDVMVGLEKKYEDLFFELAQTWSMERHAVAKILLESKALDRRVYKQSVVRRWMASMDGWQGRNKPDIFLFEGFHRLTPTGMAEKIKSGKDVPENRFLQQCGALAALHNKLCRHYDAYILELKKRLIESLRNDLPKRKNKHNVMCFDDLLTGLHSGLIGNEGFQLAQAIRRKFPAAFIDEFQDTDPLQYNIFSKVYGHVSDELLFLIGDPKQAVYSFRGADIFTYMTASQDIEEQHTLSTNYRSTPSMITAVNTLFTNVSHPFLFDKIPFQPAQPGGLIHESLNIKGQTKEGLLLRWVENSSADGKSKSHMSKENGRREILNQVAMEISQLLALGQASQATIGEKSIEPSDVAVLVRTNREARLTQIALADHKVASVIQSSESIFESREAMEMLQLLTGLADPGNTGKVRGALATDILGGNGLLYGEILADESEWIKWLLEFRHFNHIWNQHGFMRMFKELERTLKIRPGLASFVDGERRITNVSHLVEILHQAERNKNLGMAGLVKFLSRRIADPAGMEDTYQLRLESDAARVRIVTIHKAKGLQYGIVFCPFCWSGSRVSAKKPILYHQDDSQLVFDLAPDPKSVGFASAQREELAEDLRLLYVALTRAQYGCFLYWGAFRGAETSALAYLFHLPKELREKNASYGEIKNAVRDKYVQSGEQELIDDLKDIICKSSHSISLETLSSQLPHVDIAPDQYSQKIVLPPFSGSIDQSWKITSFSALTRERSHGAELPDRDHQKEIAIGQSGIQTGDEDSFIGDMFSFPAGARAGNFFHDVLENIEFQRGDQNIVRELVRGKLTEYGFDVAWYEVINSGIGKILTTPLQDDLLLERLNPEDKIHEMEFYLPLASNGALGIDDLLKHHGFPPALNMPDDKKLHLTPRQGFIKGFIDLIFLWEGKYYIIDWKSNFLGTSLQSYRQEKLHTVMQEEAYHLQYLLYTVAMHQYLAARIADYSYEDCFGGVYYLFLRGMEPQNKTSAGVYYDLPDQALVEELSSLLVLAE